MIEDQASARCRMARSRRAHARPSIVTDRLTSIATIFALQAVIAWLFRERVVSESPQLFAYLPNLAQPWLWTGFAVTAALSWALPNRIHRFGSWMGWILYLLIVVPAWPVMYSMGLEHCFGQFLLAVVGPLFMFVLLLDDTGRACTQGRRWGVLAPSIGLLFPMIVIEALILWRFQGQMVWSLDVGDVYERRLENRELAGSVWSYLLSTLDHAFIPIAIAWGIAYRRAALLLVAAVGLALIYAKIGSKSSVVIPAIMVAAGYFLRWFAGNPVRIVLSVLVLLVGLGALRNVILDGMFIERIWCSPTLTITRYLDYFSEQERLWGRDISVFNEIFWADKRSPSASSVIGEAMLGNPASNDNSNIFANGYAQAGLIGAWIAAALAAIIGRLLRRGIASDPDEFQAMIAINFAFILFETALHTSLLTGGLIVSIALQVMLRRPESGSHSGFHRVDGPEVARSG